MATVVLTVVVVGAVGEHGHPQEVQIGAHSFMYLLHPRWRDVHHLCLLFSLQVVHFGVSVLRVLDLIYALWHEILGFNHGLPC